MAKAYGCSGKSNVGGSSSDINPSSRGTFDDLKTNCSIVEGAIYRELGAVLVVAASRFTAVLGVMVVELAAATQQCSPVFV